MAEQNGTQEEALRHDADLRLHEANQRQARRGPDPAQQARLLDKMVESELEVPVDALENLGAKDFPLSNYDDEGVDTTEFKWLQEIMRLFALGRYPHPGSGLQELSRAWATGDTNNRQEALGLDEQAEVEAFITGTFSRAKRGEDMAQQETSAKQVTESHAIHEDSGSGERGGLLGKLGR